MRLSETITIYMAAGAPFGVASFMREERSGKRALALLKAAGAMLLWPFAASAILLARQRQTRRQADDGQGSLETWAAGEKLEQARRDLLASVYRVSEMAQASFGKEREKMERAARVIRESVEKYTGLAIAAREIKMRAMPDRREMELCRMAGRTGDDLLLAGLCIHRRNVARIDTHRDRAGTELVHALAEMREMPDAACLNSQSNGRDASELSEAILTSYGHAIELFSLLDNRSAALSMARLLDAECARLRRLEATILDGSQARSFGEKPCTPHVPQTVLTGLAQRSNLSRG
jgi:hypothetical protein